LVGKFGPYEPFLADIRSIDGKKDVICCDEWLE